ncbi:hypothetical protein [Acetivibrio straminisolvens]|nr:hypothetical protein [Acetivibrio straminisolvens]
MVTKGDAVDKIVMLIVIGLLQSIPAKYILKINESWITEGSYGYY